MGAPDQSPNFNRTRAIFDTALEYPPGPQRDSFVESSSAGDTALEAEVRRLLRSYDSVAPRISEPWPRFGPYQTKRILGRGGMGVVYEAYRADGEFDRRVAIKVISEAALATFLHEDLRRERQILAALDHPGIARLFDGGVTAWGAPFLVVEFVEGEHLDEYCSRRKLDAAARLRLFEQILDAVAYAHSRGVIHRDLKPSNILVSTDGRVKLVDFGAATVIRSGDATVTVRGYTPEYASPEQLTGRQAGPRSDIYSLGIIYKRILGADAREDIVRKATELDPAQRHASVQELRSALRRHPRARAALFALVFALAALAAFAVSRQSAPRITAISPPGQFWLDASVSAGGEWIAFSSSRGTPGRYDIWVSHADGSDPERLLEDEAFDRSPALSPDGRYVAFFSRRDPPGLYEFDRGTKQTRLIAAGGRRAAYSPSGTGLLFTIADNNGDPIRSTGEVWFLVPARGGQPHPVGRPLRRVINAIWAGEEDTIVFQEGIEPMASFRLWTQRPGSDTPGKLAEINIRAIQNVALCSAGPNGALWGIRGETELVSILLEPHPVLKLVARLPARASGCSASRDGSLFVRLDPLRSRHYRIPGLPGATPQRVGQGGDGLFQDVSADGQSWLVLGSYDGPLTWRRAAQATEISGGDVGVLSNDGLSVWFRHKRDNIRSLIHRRSGEEHGQEFVLVGLPWDASADGKRALGYIHPAAKRSVSLLDSENRAVTSILSHPSWNLYRAVFSRDERHIAFTAVREDESRWVMVAPFRGKESVPPGQWREVARGTAPTFSIDGRRLFYLSNVDGSSCIYAAPLGADGLPAGPHTAVAHFHDEESPGLLPSGTFRMSDAADGLHLSLGRRESSVVRIE
ncbi:MAG: protein kinase [Bryobacteraceae bacterium]